MQLVILGRQPELSHAELESITGQSVQFTSPRAAIVNQPLDLDRLGGVQKIGQIIQELPLTSHLATVLSELIHSLVPGPKLTFGLSFYDLKFDSKAINKIGLEIKKRLKPHYQHLRFVPVKNTILNAAQVQHNHLARGGLELLIAGQGGHLIVARTEQVQDIDNYSKRDYGRPCRNPKIGMTPPKLAQIMLNLARPAEDGLVIDPFCGPGTILQEALLHGFNVAGSDIDAAMIDCARANLDWLKKEYAVSAKFELTQADATTTKLPQPIAAVVTEGYLGPPLEQTPTATDLADLKRKAATLTTKFLSNLSTQIPPGTPVCLCLPAWRIVSKIERLGIIDQIVSLGYNTERFTLPSQPLIYQRENQIVAREILSLRKA